MRKNSESIIITEATRYLRNKGVKASDLIPQEQRDLLLQMIEASFSLTGEE